MPSFLLRLEGVNHSSIIHDTDDLSTRRGGGLMLLNAAAQLKSKLPESLSEKLTEIATGASVGLFQFTAKDATEAEDFRKQVADEVKRIELIHEKGELPLKHATFVVDFAEVTKGEQQAEQLATAKNRWRQMQEPSLSLEILWSEASDACYFDCVRPATEPIHLPEGQKVTGSASVASRRSYGRGARQKFYRDELKDPKFDMHFTNDFRTLAKIQSQEGRVINPVEKNGEDKLAVFYVDGNDFGKKGVKVFKDGGAKEFEKWSQGLREHHRNLLKGLIEKATGDAAWRYFDSKENVDRIRLETLLWGGDEILWVVPAWKGWELAEWFFRQTHEVDGQPLTYGCGLVFCHANAPINNITRLAHELGDLAKATRKSKNVNVLAYEVLESFDDIQGDLAEQRKKWLPKGMASEALVFDPTRLQDTWTAICKLAGSEEFPTRQLYRLCKQWRSGENFDVCENRLKADELREPVEAFQKMFAGSPIGYLHLLQMLPYIPALKNGSQR